MSRLVIAIDGFAASGKATLAKRIAGYFGLDYLDTGLLYRAIGSAMHENGVDFMDEGSACAIARELDYSDLNDPRLRGESVGIFASRVSVYPGVRSALLEFQRDFASSFAGAVLDGRDIGTVVCPQAAVKFFVTANFMERVKRRRAESVSVVGGVTHEAVRTLVWTRDRMDVRRFTSPLRLGVGSRILDTTFLTADEVFNIAEVLIEKAL